jgi:hypothetical protein
MIKTNEQARLRSLVHAGCAFIMLAVGCQSTLPVVDGEPQNAAGSGGSNPSSAANGAKGSKVIARAVANLAPFGSGTLAGKVTFEKSESGTVSGSSDLHNCEEGKTYYVYVRDGHGCGSEAEIGGSWRQDPDGAFTTCFNGVVDAFALRIAQPTRPSDWSIGDGSASDVVGHAVVVTLDDENTINTKDLGCGVAMKSN